MFVPVWTNCLFNMFNYTTEWLHISFTYFASRAMFANSLQSDATGAHSCLQRTQITIPIDAKRGKRRSSAIEAGAALLVSLKAWKRERKRESADKHPLMPPSEKKMLSCAHSLARTPARVHTNKHPPSATYTRNGGGRGEERMMSPL